MEIKIKRIGPYRAVDVKHDTTNIEVGLLSYEECKELARTFKDAISELLGDDDYYNLMTEDKFPPV